MFRGKKFSTGSENPYYPQFNKHKLASFKTLITKFDENVFSGPIRFNTDRQTKL